MRQAGIHTCLDTAGVGLGSYDAILRWTDLVLFDVKHETPEGYRRVTGCGMERAETFLQAVRRAGTPMWVRHVVVPGLTDSEAHMLSLIHILQEFSRPVNYIYHIGQYLPDWHPWENYKNFFVGDKRTGGVREIFGIDLPWLCLLYTSRCV